MGPLADLLVLELADGIAPGYCGRLFAGFGATVVKAEPPGGTVLRRMRAVPGAQLPHADEAPWWLYLGAGKSSVVSLLEAGGLSDKVRDLAQQAHVVIVDRATEAALGYDDLAHTNPGVVYLSLTPFGRVGPDAGLPAENITAFAMGPQMWLTGEPGREPLCTAGEQAWMQLGQSGFAAACFALYGVQQTGLGQLVEVSAQEVMAGATEGFGPNARYLGVAQGRSGRARFSMMGIYPCADGYAGIYGTNRQLPLFSRIAGRPEVGADGRFQSLAGILQHNDELAEFVTGYMALRTKGEIRAVGRETGMTIAPVASIAEVAASEHLAARQFFVTVPTPTGKTVTMPGRPFNMSATPWESRPAPRLGELERASAPTEQPATAPPIKGTVPRDRPSGGLLAGVRILDLTAYWAGPYATKWLADFGADIVKVESPALLDFIRATTVAPNHERPWDGSAYFNNYNRGKRSLSLDPAHPDGRQTLLEMLPHFDVVIENFKAGRMDSLRLSYEDLRSVKPDIIMVSISGYGADGPDSTLAGVGTNMEQLSGLAWLNQYSDSDQPYNTGIAYGDPTSGTAGAAAVAMALRHRDRSGEGQYVEISGHETIAGLIGEQFAALSLGLDPRPKGNRHPDMAPHGCFPCAGDDQWVTIAVRDDRDWQALCAILGQPDLESAYPTFEARKAAEDELEAAVIGWSVGTPAEEALRLLRAAGIPSGPVLSTLDLPNDPHLRLRGYYVTIDHPDQGPWPHDGIAWRMSRTPGHVGGPAPLFDQHTREVLRQYLALSEDDIDALYASGASASRPHRW